MKQICGIYKIQNLINQKVYIGKSKNIEERWKQEKKFRSINKHLKSAILKYGIENFSFEVIYLCEEKQLNIAEITFIRLYCSTFKKFGYNMTFGGDGGKPTLKKDVYTNGIVNKWFGENEIIPDGFIKGSHVKPHLGKKMYTDGKINIFSKDCPKNFSKGSSLKGKKTFTNGLKNIISDSCPEGFWLGSKTKGVKCWTDGNIDVHSETCPEGFYKGSNTKGKKCWTNGEKMVYADKCPDGYKPFVGSNIGKKCWTNGKENIRSIDCPSGFWRGITFTKNCAKNKGMKLYTNGKEQKYCEKCPDGWWQGSCKQAYIKGKKCYTNGIKNRYFNDDDEIPEDFYLGSYKKKNICPEIDKK